jgi:hypothetical protein
MRLISLGSRYRTIPDASPTPMPGAVGRSKRAPSCLRFPCWPGAPALRPAYARILPAELGGSRRIP